MCVCKKFHFVVWVYFKEELVYVGGQKSVKLYLCLHFSCELNKL